MMRQIMARLRVMARPLTAQQGSVSTPLVVDMPSAPMDMLEPAAWGGGIEVTEEEASDPVGWGGGGGAGLPCCSVLAVSNAHTSCALMAGCAHETLRRGGKGLTAALAACVAPAAGAAAAAPKVQLEAGRGAALARFAALA